MENFESFSIDIKDGILKISIGNSTGSTYIDSKFIKGLKLLLTDVYNDNSVKGIIITGKGEDFFATGFGIEELTILTKANDRKFSEEGQEVFSMIENYPKPVIAAVNGIAEGSGCELALACHIRLATEKATFRVPEVYLGLIPGFGATQRLPQIVGKGNALEIMMTASTIKASYAKDMGLVNHIMSDKESMLKRCVEIIGKTMRNSPLAVSMLIDCINASYNSAIDGYQMEANSFEHCCNTDYFKNKIAQRRDDQEDIDI